MKTSTLLPSSKPRVGHESGPRQVRFLGPTASAHRQTSLNLADHPQFSPKFLVNGRAVDPLTRRVLVRMSGPKANRRNGGGPKKGRSLAGINLEAGRARFDAHWTKWKGESDALVNLERDACAKAVEALKPEPSPTATRSAEVEAGMRWDAFDDAAIAIRARGSKP